MDVTQRRRTIQSGKYSVILSKSFTMCVEWFEKGVLYTLSERMKFKFLDEK